MDSTGRIGVGTDDPGNTVHLGAGEGLGLRFENYTSGNSSFLTLESGDLFQSNVGGSGDFGWVAGGGRKMTLSNAGNLGIGTDNPSRKIHINSGSTDTAMLIESTDADVQINLKDVDSSNGISIGCDQDDFYVRTGLTTERFRIQSDGTVKIGTGTGNPILMLNASTAGTSVIQMGDSDDNNIGQIQYANSDDSMRFFANNAERLRISGVGTVMLRANQGSAETNIIRFEDTDTSAAANQKFGQLQWYSNDVSGAGPCVKGEIYVAAQDTTPDGYMVFATHDGGSSTVATERMRISSDGKTGIGTDNPATKLDVRPTAEDPTTGSPATGAFSQIRADDATVGKGPSLSLMNLSGSKETGWRISALTASGNNGDLTIHGYNGGATYSERLRITADGQLLVGNTSARANLNDGTDSAHIQLEGTTQNTSTLSVIRNSNNDGPAHLVLGKSRGGSANSTTVLNNGDSIGQINFEGADGTHLIRGAEIRAQTVSGTGANDMPTKLEFRTNGGTTSVTTRMIIHSDGSTQIGSDPPVSGSTSVTGFRFDYGDGFWWSTTGANSYWNTSQDTVWNFRRNGTQVGSISINSTSTDYNISGSDSRLKKNFETWDEEVLPYFKSLQPKKFNFTHEDDGTEKTKGYVAQDNVDKFPEAYPLQVNPETNESRYMYNPSGMVAYLMKALQEEIAKREALESQYDAILARLDALEG